jgi:hypothetical protein
MMGQGEPEAWERVQVVTTLKSEPPVSTRIGGEY